MIQAYWKQYMDNKTGKSKWNLIESTNSKFMLTILVKIRFDPVDSQWYAWINPHKIFNFQVFDLISQKLKILNGTL